MTLPHLGTEGTSCLPGAPVLSLGLAWTLPGRLSLPQSSDLQFPPSSAPHSLATCGLQHTNCTGVWGHQGTRLSNIRAWPRQSPAGYLWVGRDPQTKVLWGGTGVGRHSWGRVGEGPEYFFFFLVEL